MEKFENLSQKLKNIILNKHLPNNAKILEICTQNGQSLADNLKDDYFKIIIEEQILKDLTIKDYIENNHNKYAYFVEL